VWVDHGLVERDYEGVAAALQSDQTIRFFADEAAMLAALEQPPSA
jgi:hypothetical protein